MFGSSSTLLGIASPRPLRRLATKSAVPATVLSAIAATGMFANAQVIVAGVSADQNTKSGVFILGANGNRRPILALQSQVTLLAGAQVSPNPTPTVSNVPVQTPPTTLPTMLVYPGGPFSKPVALRTRPGFRYDTVPKNFNAPMSTGIVSQTVGPNMASARANATFTLNNASYSTSTAGTFANVVGSRRVGKRAGALVLDPLTFSAPNGTVISTDLSFGSGMNVTLDPHDPNLVEGYLFEGGANLPGLSPGAVGRDNNGDPLFYDLSVTFDNQLNGPLVTLKDDRTVGNFYVPGTTTVLSDHDIITEIEDDFTFSSSTDTWSTVMPVDDLFEYDSNALSGVPAGGMMLNLDINAGVAIQDVPEAGVGALALAAVAAGAVILRGRRAR